MPDNENAPVPVRCDGSPAIKMDCALIHGPLRLEFSVRQHPRIIQRRTCVITILRHTVPDDMHLPGLAGGDLSSANSAGGHRAVGNCVNRDRFFPVCGIPRAARITNVRAIRLPCQINQVDRATTCG